MNAFNLPCKAFDVTEKIKQSCKSPESIRILFQRGPDRTTVRTFKLDVSSTGNNKATQQVGLLRNYTSVAHSVTVTEESVEAVKCTFDRDEPPNNEKWKWVERGIALPQRSLECWNVFIIYIKSYVQTPDREECLPFCLTHSDLDRICNSDFVKFFH